MKIENVPVVDKLLLIPVIIGGIGMAGVILGLYCANIASIYSSKYSNAPNEISDAFQRDKLTRECISGIVNYIIFGLLIIFYSMIASSIGWVTVIVFVFWSILVVVSYSIAGNRTYQLSDVYGVAADSNRILCRIVTNSYFAA